MVRKAVLAQVLPDSLDCAGFRTATHKNLQAVGYRLGRGIVRDAHLVGDLEVSPAQSETHHLAQEFLRVPYRPARQSCPDARVLAPEPHDDDSTLWIQDPAVLARVVTHT